MARTIAELREWLAAVEAWASGTEPTGPYRVTPHVTAVDAAVEALAAIRQDVLDTAPDAPAWAGTFRVQKQMLGRWHVAHLPTRTALPGGDYASADEARRYADAVWPLADWPAIRAVQFEHEWGELAQACLKARKAVRAAQ